MSDRAPAHVQPYVDALGVDTAIEFLMTFGGAELHIPQTPAGGGMVEQRMGRDVAFKLAKIADRLPARVPLAKPWIAATLREKGLSVSEIARRLHASDVAVRGWLAQGPKRRAPDHRQPDLF